MRLIFLRHPETTANEQNLIYGKTDYPYTKRGQKQFEEALVNIERFGFDKILTSPLRRAYELASAIASKTSKELIVHEALEEMNFGIFEGLTEEEAKLKHPGIHRDFVDCFETTLFPEGESFDIFKKRVESFLNDYKQSETDWLVVSHGGFIRTALEYLLDNKSGSSWFLEIGNCSIIEIHVNEGKPSMIKNILNP
ncbi:histidine phosphatase family protein [Petrocella sp. FN5]|uniref:histidine phosphatase family protein n=1 Tax=Petrocella sp. FN5 TaxID=3032002 RepID=UPI0023DC6F9D|nr:histidine phosphatase family protein [Petrocella sp. FN5]MDF1616646.1 histidine phosphatase family protein [Petrocella sp. FN5]